MENNFLFFETSSNRMILFRVQKNLSKPQQDL